MLNRKDVFIVGSGFAGLTCKLYLALSGIQATVLYDNQSPKPLYMLKNFPGMLEKTSLGLLDDLKSQIKVLDAEFDANRLASNVLSVKKENDLILVEHFVTGEGRREEYCKYLVIATGFSYRKLGLSVNADVEKKILYSVDNADDFLGEVVVVIGSGDRAASYLSLLINVCKRVHVVIRTREIRAWNRAIFEHERVDCIYGAVVKSFDGETVSVFSRVSGETLNIRCFSLVAAIGIVPSFPNMNVSVRDDGLIEVDENMETTERNIFAAGVVSSVHQQALNACSSGSIAAMEITYREKGLKPNYYK